MMVQHSSCVLRSHFNITSIALSSQYPPPPLVWQCNVTASESIRLHSLSLRTLAVLFGKCICHTSVATSNYSIVFYLYRCVCVYILYMWVCIVLCYFIALHVCVCVVHSVSYRCAKCLQHMLPRCPASVTRQTCWHISNYQNDPYLLQRILKERGSSSLTDRWSTLQY